MEDIIGISRNRILRILGGPYNAPYEVSLIFYKLLYKQVDEVAMELPLEPIKDNAFLFHNELNLSIYL